MRSKGNYKQGEKTARGMEENDSKGNNDKELISKCTSSSYNSIPEKQTTQIQNVGRRPKQTFLRRRHTDG